MAKICHVLHGPTSPNAVHTLNNALPCYRHNAALIHGMARYTPRREPITARRVKTRHAVSFIMPCWMDQSRQHGARQNRA